MASLELRNIELLECCVNKILQQMHKIFKTSTVCVTVDNWFWPKQSELSIDQLINWSRMAMASNWLWVCCLCFRPNVYVGHGYKLVKYGMFVHLRQRQFQSVLSLCQKHMLLLELHWVLWFLYTVAMPWPISINQVCALVAWQSAGAILCPFPF